MQATKQLQLLTQHSWNEHMTGDLIMRNEFWQQMIPLGF